MYVKVIIDPFELLPTEESTQTIFTIIFGVIVILVVEIIIRENFSCQDDRTLVIKGPWLALPVSCKIKTNLPLW